MKENTDRPLRRKRKLIIAVAFLACVACLMAYLITVFDSRTEDQLTTNQLYNEEDNTLDGIYIGTSAAYRYWIPTKAYEDYGMCIYNMGTSSQALPLAQYIIESTVQKQPDAVYVIELRNVIKKTKNMEEADIRRVTDNMPPSAVRYKAIKACLDYYKASGADIDYSMVDYLLPFLQYHSRWNDDIEVSDLKPHKEYASYKGFITSGGFERVRFEEPEEYTSERPLEKPTEDVLNDLLDYCDTIDRKVIFVASPFTGSKWEYEKINAAGRICEDRGYTVWNFNKEPLRSELGMDWDGDYYDPFHCNVYGAQKYTAMVSKMLSEECDLADHRGDEAYESWEEASRNLNKRFEKNK